jgi:hypothetical protein
MCPSDTYKVYKRGSSVRSVFHPSKVKSRGIISKKPARVKRACHKTVRVKRAYLKTCSNKNSLPVRVKRAYLKTCLSKKIVSENLLE